MQVLLNRKRKKSFIKQTKAGFSGTFPAFESSPEQVFLYRAFPFYRRKIKLNFIRFFGILDFFIIYDILYFEEKDILRNPQKRKATPIDERKPEKRNLCCSH